MADKTPEQIRAERKAAIAKAWTGASSRTPAAPATRPSRGRRFESAAAESEE